MRLRRTKDAVVLTLHGSKGQAMEEGRPRPGAVPAGGREKTAQGTLKYLLSEEENQKLSQWVTERISPNSARQPTM